MLYRITVNPEQVQNQIIKLQSEQEHYLRRVVRLNNEDNFIAIDGRGNCWLAKLTPNHGCIVRSIDENKELPIAVTLIVALPKGQGFEEIIRMTTELGVTQIQPVISDRTILKPNANKLIRWRKIAAEAAEQSERQIIPDITPVVSVKEAFSAANNLNIPKYLAFARSTTPHLQHILTKELEQSIPPQIIIATGCEGGWTNKEVEFAVNKCNFEQVSLGKRILRAVTAPVMVMSLLSAMIDSQINDHHQNF